MDLRDLVEAILKGDLLTARQWVADAYRSKVDWRTFDLPDGLNARALVVAAAVAELLADRAAVPPPIWTATVGGSMEALVLDPGLEKMPRSFALAQTDGPLPLRRRNLIALPDFLHVA
jgi:hypothetical protein